jgi:hypothetical protein
MHGLNTQRNSDRERMSQAEPPARHFNKTGVGKDTVSAEISQAPLACDIFAQSSWLCMLAAARGAALKNRSAVSLLVSHVSIQICSFYRQSGSDRLAKNPFWTQRNLGYLGDGAPGALNRRTRLPILASPLRYAPRTALNCARSLLSLGLESRANISGEASPEP